MGENRLDKNVVESPAEGDIEVGGVAENWGLHNRNFLTKFASKSIID